MVPTIEVKRSFIPSTDPKTGKRVSIPVTHRKLLLEGKTSPKLERVVVVKRHGENRYSVSHMPEPVQPWWEKQRGVPAPQVDWVRSDAKSLDRDEILKWLKPRVVNPEAVLTELETAVPVKAAA